MELKQQWRLLGLGFRKCKVSKVKGGRRSPFIGLLDSCLKKSGATIRYNEHRSLLTNCSAKRQKIRTFENSEKAGF
jgi:hypothetical protein